MSSFIYLQGGDGTEITVPAGSSITVFSRADVAVSIKMPGVGASRPNIFSRFGVAPGGTEKLFGPFTDTTIVRLDAGAAQVIYSVGTNPIILERRSSRYSPFQAAPSSLNATGSLSAAAIASGLITSTTAAAVSGTLPVANSLNLTNQYDLRESFDWSVINTGPNSFTIVADTGHTIVGNAVVATATTGMFKTVKTGPTAFTTYRVA